MQAVLVMKVVAIVKIAKTSNGSYVIGTTARNARIDGVKDPLDRIRLISVKNKFIHLNPLNHHSIQ
jgi:hypothetical protein